MKNPRILSDVKGKFNYSLSRIFLVAINSVTWFQRLGFKYLFLSRIQFQSDENSWP